MTTPTTDPVARHALVPAAIALIAAGMAVAVWGDEEAAGLALAAALTSGALAVVFAGAPFGRAGRPSVARIAVLFAMGVAGIVLMATVDRVVALGVIAVSFAIVELSTARWAPAAGDGAVADKPPRGMIAALAGTFLAFFAVTGLIVDATDSDGVRLALGVVLVVAMLAWWGRIHARFTGRQSPGVRVTRTES